jgi:uncharacterized membrane protein YgcG
MEDVPMMRWLFGPIAALVLAFAIASAVPLRAPSAQQPPIYGQQLMTEQERAEYRARMQAARTEQEREQIRLEHHREMQERAREQGIELPEQPPMMGMGQGGGMGQSMGQGGGMGQGMGSGRGMGGAGGGGRGGGRGN